MPDVSVELRNVPGNALLSKLQSVLFASLFVVIGLQIVNHLFPAARALAPAALVQFLRSYPSAPIMLYVAQALIGNMNKSGAFEIIDGDTNAKLFSKLESGKVPSPEEVVARLQPSVAAPTAPARRRAVRGKGQPSVQAAPTASVTDADDAATAPPPPAPAADPPLDAPQTAVKKDN